MTCHVYNSSCFDYNCIKRLSLTNINTAKVMSLPKKDDISQVLKLQSALSDPHIQ